MTFGTNTTLKLIMAKIILWTKRFLGLLNEPLINQINQVGQRVHAKSDLALEDCAEFDIQWEEIAIGERIGLGKVDLLFDYL